MGELEKEKGAWGYVEGGMGGVSQAIASSARSYGVDIFTEKVMCGYSQSYCSDDIFDYILCNIWVFGPCPYKIDPLPAMQEVGQVLVGPDGAAKGVVLKDGTEIRSKVVLSNATPYVTFRNLIPQVTKKN